MSYYIGYLTLGAVIAVGVLDVNNGCEFGDRSLGF